MESFQVSTDKRGKIRKKIIPWHCQQRYQTGISQVSINHSQITASNNRKIKSLLHNNKCLAKALERSQNELSGKENIIVENAKNIDIINFSGIKLRDVCNNLKKLTACVDETVALLQSHSDTNTTKHLQCTSVSRNDFKRKLRAISSIEPLEEVAESLENDISSQENLKESQNPVLNIKHTNKNKNSKNKAKNTSSATDKKDKTVQKSRKQSSKLQNVTLSEKVSVRISKPQTDDTPPSYLFGLSSESFENFMEYDKTADSKALKQKPLKPKRNRAKKLNSELQPTTTKDNSKDQQQKELSKTDMPIQNSINKKRKKDIPVKTKSKAGKCAPRKKAKANVPLFNGSKKSQSSSEDILSSTNGMSSENVEEQTNSFPETNLEVLKTSSKMNISKNGNDGILNSYVYPLDLQFDKETSKLNGDLTTVLPNKPENKMYKASASAIPIDQASIQPRVLLKKSIVTQCATLQKKQPVSTKNIDESHGLGKKVVTPKSNLKTLNTSCHGKKVQFLFQEEDEIEMLSDIGQPLAEPKTKKSQKRPLKESAQNLAHLPSKKQAVSKTVKETSKNVGMEDKNTFIVTAEVHQPPDGFNPERKLGPQSINLSKMQPSVVLTDIFKLGFQKKSDFENIYHTSTLMDDKGHEISYSENSSEDRDLNDKRNKEK